jgi:HK97 family phage prohead protease
MEKKSQNNIEIEVRSIVSDLQIRQKDDGKKGRVITGYAAKFDTWSEPIYGWFKEQIARGAFDKTDMSDVIMVFNHDISGVLARTTSGTLTLSVDDTGLRFEFEAPETTLGNDMLELVGRGDISKCSFKFVVEADEWRYADDKNKLELDERTVKSISKLYDVSLVTYPAYKDTEASVREHLEQRKREALVPKSVDTSSRDRVAIALGIKAKL